MKDPTFLKAMVQKAQARQVLEIGTFDGTSALAMAEMLPDDGPSSPARSIPAWPV